MSIAAILAAIGSAVSLIPSAIEAGKSISGIVGNIQKITSKDPNAITQADLDALQAENDTLRKEIEELEGRDT